MNKDLERFENRSDDWLAKQRKRENKISAWDFDEGMKIKEYHKDHCEAKEIKEKHEMIHSGQTKLKSKKQKNSSPFLTILLILIAIDVIPSIIVDEDITVIPLGIIGALVFTYTLFYLIKKRRQ